MTTKERITKSPVPASARVREEVLAGPSAADIAAAAEPSIEKTYGPKSVAESRPVPPVVTVGTVDLAGARDAAEIVGRLAAAARPAVERMIDIADRQYRAVTAGKDTGSGPPPRDAFRVGSVFQASSDFAVNTAERARLARDVTEAALRAHRALDAWLRDRRAAAGSAVTPSAQEAVALSVEPLAALEQAADEAIGRGDAARARTIALAMRFAGAPLTRTAPIVARAESLADDSAAAIAYSDALAEVEDLRTIVGSLDRDAGGDTPAAVANAREWASSAVSA